MRKKQELLKNTVILGVGVLFARAITFLLLPFYTLFLTPAEYGTVDIIMTYAAYLAPFIILQSDWAVFRFLIDARGDKREIARVTSTSLSFILTVSALFAALIVLVSLFINIPHLPLVILVLLSTIFSTVMLQYARGLGKNIQYAVSSIITGVFTAAGFFIFVVWLSLGVSGVLLSAGVAQLGVAIYLFIKLRIIASISIRYIDKRLRKKMLSYSWPLGLESISWWVMNSSDRTIISIFIGVAANGLYAVANKYSLILNVAFSVLNLSWSQSIAEHIDEKDSFVSDVSNITVRFFGSLGLVMIAILPLIFSLLFAETYREAYYYVPILILANVFYAAAGIYSGVYIAKNLTKQIARTTIAASIINIIINLALISFIGVYAAAISTMVAYLVLAIYRHYDVKKYVTIIYDLRMAALLMFMYTFVILMYYLNIPNLNVLSALVTIGFSVVYNRSVIVMIKNKLMRHHRRLSPKQQAMEAIEERDM